MYIASDERGLAIEAANKAVKLAPESSQAWNTLGRAELARFNYDGAITAFNKATELDRDNVWAWNNLGFTELQLKHYDKAVDALVEATSRRRARPATCSTTSAPRTSSSIGSTKRASRSTRAASSARRKRRSRKRLDGVKTLAVTKPLAPEVQEPAGEVKVESVEAVDAGVPNPQPPQTL